MKRSQLSLSDPFADIVDDAATNNCATTPGNIEVKIEPIDNLETFEANNKKPEVEIVGDIRYKTGYVVRNRNGRHNRYISFISDICPQNQLDTRFRTRKHNEPGTVSKKSTGSYNLRSECPESPSPSATAYSDQNSADKCNSGELRKSKIHPSSYDGISSMEERDRRSRYKRSQRRKHLPDDDDYVYDTDYISDNTDSTYNNHVHSDSSQVTKRKRTDTISDSDYHGDNDSVTMRIGSSRVHRTPGNRSDGYSSSDTPNMSKPETNDHSFDDDTFCGHDTDSAGDSEFSLKWRKKIIKKRQKYIDSRITKRDKTASSNITANSVEEADNGGWKQRTRRGASSKLKKSDMESELTGNVIGAEGNYSDVNLASCSTSYLNTTTTSADKKWLRDRSLIRGTSLFPFNTKPSVYSNISIPNMDQNIPSSQLEIPSFRLISELPKPKKVTILKVPNENTLRSLMRKRWKFMLQKNSNYLEIRDKNSDVRNASSDKCKDSDINKCNAPHVVSAAMQEEMKDFKGTRKRSSTSKFHSDREVCSGESHIDVSLCRLSSNADIGGPLFDKSSNKQEVSKKCLLGDKKFKQCHMNDASHGTTLTEDTKIECVQNLTSNSGKKAKGGGASIAHSKDDGIQNAFNTTSANSNEESIQHTDYKQVPSSSNEGPVIIQYKKPGSPKRQEFLKKQNGILASCLTRLNNLRKSSAFKNGLNRLNVLYKLSGLSTSQVNNKQNSSSQENDQVHSNICCDDATTSTRDALNERDKTMISTSDHTNKNYINSHKLRSNPIGVNTNHDNRATTVNGVLPISLDFQKPSVHSFSSDNVNSGYNTVEDGNFDHYAMLNAGKSDVTEENTENVSHSCSYDLKNKALNTDGTKVENVLSHSIMPHKTFQENNTCSEIIQDHVENRSSNVFDHVTSNFQNENKSMQAMSKVIGDCGKTIIVLEGNNKVKISKRTFRNKCLIIEHKKKKKVSRKAENKQIIEYLRSRGIHVKNDCPISEIVDKHINAVSSDIRQVVMEETDDRYIRRRHDRYEGDEKRRKRWDTQRVRELRRIAHLKEKLKNRKNKWDRYDPTVAEDNNIVDTPKIQFQNTPAVINYRDLHTGSWARTHHLIRKRRQTSDSVEAESAEEKFRGFTSENDTEHAEGVLLPYNLRPFIQEPVNIAKAENRMPEYRLRKNELNNHNRVMRRRMKARNRILNMKRKIRSRIINRQRQWLNRHGSRKRMRNNLLKNNRCAVNKEIVLPKTDDKKMPPSTLHPYFTRSVSVSKDNTDIKCSKGYIDLTVDLKSNNDETAETIDLECSVTNEVENLPKLKEETSSSDKVTCKLEKQGELGNVYLIPEEEGLGCSEVGNKDNSREAPLVHMADPVEQKSQTEGQDEVCTLSTDNKNVTSNISPGSEEENLNCNEIGQHDNSVMFVTCELMDQDFEVQAGVPEDQVDQDYEVQGGLQEDTVDESTLDESSLLNTSSVETSNEEDTPFVTVHDAVYVECNDSDTPTNSVNGPPSGLSFILSHNVKLCTESHYSQNATTKKTLLPEDESMSSKNLRSRKTLTKSKENKQKHNYSTFEQRGCDVSVKEIDTEVVRNLRNRTIVGEHKGDVEKPSENHTDVDNHKGTVVHEGLKAEKSSVSGTLHIPHTQHLQRKVLPNNDQHVAHDNHDESNEYSQQIGDKSEGSKIQTGNRDSMCTDSKKLKKRGSRYSERLREKQVKSEENIDKSQNYELSMEVGSNPDLILNKDLDIQKLEINNNSPVIVLPHVESIMELVNQGASTKVDDTKYSRTKGTKSQKLDYVDVERMITPTVQLKKAETSHILKNHVKDIQISKEQSSTICHNVTETNDTMAAKNLRNKKIGSAANTKAMVVIEDVKHKEKINNDDASTATPYRTLRDGKSINTNQNSNPEVQLQPCKLEKFQNDSEGNVHKVRKFADTKLDDKTSTPTNMEHVSTKNMVDMGMKYKQHDTCNDSVGDVTPYRTLRDGKSISIDKNLKVKLQHCKVENNQIGNVTVHLIESSTDVAVDDRMNVLKNTEYRSLRDGKMVITEHHSKLKLHTSEALKCEKHNVNIDTGPPKSVEKGNVCNTEDNDNTNTRCLRPRKILQCEKNEEMKTKVNKKVSIHNLPSSRSHLKENRKETCK